MHSGEPSPAGTVGQPEAAREDPPHPGQVLSALSSPVRLRVFAVLVLHAPASPDEVAALSGTSLSETRRALDRLAGSGLAAAGDDGRWEVVGAALAGSARLASRLAVEPDPGEAAANPQQAAVLRAYLRRGRLRSIPAQRSKRLVVLDWISQSFEPGRTYPESAVNAILERLHPDVASLRRFLVDEGMMDRRGGFYWRSGGTFEVG